MSRRTRSSLLRGDGFTLVELITVMVILGVLAIGAVRFVTDSSSGFAATITRSQLAGDTRYVAERIAREVRNALPNSVRAAGGCLEFVPVLGASRYLTLPVAAAAVQFRSAPPEPMPLPAGSRIAVYPDVDVYSLGAQSVISPPVAGAAPGPGNEVLVSFAAPHRFPKGSPAARYFVVSEPVSYCVDGGSLYRYTGYGFIATQPLPGDLPSGLPGRGLVAEQVSSTTPFQVSGATLTRNAVVQMDFLFARVDDEIRLEHAVQVRNVP